VKQLENIAMATWTHSSYYDIWPMYYGQLKKHAPYFKHYMIVNEHTHSTPPECIQITNKEDDIYYKRFVESLSQIEEEYVIYMQEDFVLYDDVKSDDILKLKEFIKNSDYDYIRLSKSGVEGGAQVLIHPPAYEVPQRCGNNPPGIFNLIKSPRVHPRGDETSPYIFSYQATLWKRERLIRLFNFYKPNSIMEGELYGSYACLNTNTSGCYIYNGEPKRGNLHYDSSVFPYISSALHGGSHGQRAKWCLSAYPNELGPLLQKYNIDPSDRGTI